MFFPVRCIFWLTIVYTSITWPGVLPGAQSLAIDGLATATATVTTAATDVCLASPSACADKIALLSQLVEDMVPLPIPRPAQAAPVRTDARHAEDKAAPSRLHHPG